MNKTDFVSCDVLPIFAKENSIDVLTSIVGCMYCGIVMAKTEGNFLVWNAKAAEVLGEKVDIPPEKWPEHYGCYNPETEELMDYTELPLFKALTGIRVENYVILLKNHIVDRAWISCNADPIIHDGEIIGGVIVFQNITKEKLLHEQAVKLALKLDLLAKKQESMINDWQHN